MSLLRDTFLTRLDHECTPLAFAQTFDGMNRGAFCAALGELDGAEVERLYLAADRAGYRFPWPVPTFVALDRAPSAGALPLNEPPTAAELAQDADTAYERHGFGKGWLTDWLFSR